MNNFTLYMVFNDIENVRVAKNKMQ